MPAVVPNLFEHPYSRCRLGPMLVMSGVLICSPAWAQDQHLVRTTKADREINILGYARANQSCEGIDPPSLFLDKPPEHGSVCFRPSKLKLQEAIVGNFTQCVGRQVLGVTVVYIPQTGYSGTDEVRYTVIFPQARHVVYVDLSVVPGQPKPAGVAQGDGNFAADKQSQGPIRACTELVS
jgi:hypothetical protein